jgi:hypothetical protein
MLLLTVIASVVATSVVGLFWRHRRRKALDATDDQRNDRSHALEATNGTPLTTSGT